MPKSMDVLIDTNVLINFITERDDPFRTESRKVMELCADGKFSGYLAFHSLSTVWYVVKKFKGEEEARFWLENLCDLLTITGATQEQVTEAIKNRIFKDFEDCLQDECAQSVNADYLVTCNLKDYKNAKTKAVTPDILIAILEGGGAWTN